MPRSHDLGRAAAPPIGSAVEDDLARALGSRPAMRAGRCDLPAPLAPMTATVSPCVDAQVDAEQRLEVAVEGGEPARLEHRPSGLDAQ